MEPGDFKFQPKNRLLDWSKFGPVNINQLMQSPDFSILQDNLLNVAMCNASQEFDFSKIDPNFTKLFLLGQLIIEYLLYAQDHLLKKIGNNAKVIKKLEQERNDNAKQVNDLTLDLKKLRVECHNRKKLLKKQQNMMNLHQKSSFKCAFCKDKTFISEAYWMSHMLNRHADAQMDPRPLEPIMDEVEKLKKENLKLKEDLQDIQKRMEREIDDFNVFKNKQVQREAEEKKAGPTRSTGAANALDVSLSDFQNEFDNDTHFMEVNQQDLLIKEIMRENEYLKEANMRLKAMERMISSKAFTEKRPERARKTDRSRSRGKYGEAADDRKRNNRKSPNYRDAKSRSQKKSHEEAAPTAGASTVPQADPRGMKDSGSKSPRSRGEPRGRRPENEGKEKMSVVPVAGKLPDADDKVDDAEPGDEASIDGRREEVEKEPTVNKEAERNLWGGPRRREVRPEGSKLKPLKSGESAKEHPLGENKLVEEVRDVMRHWNGPGELQTDGERMASIRREVEGEMFLLLKSIGVQSLTKISKEAFEKASRLMELERNTTARNLHGFSDAREELRRWLDSQISLKLLGQESTARTSDLPFAGPGSLGELRVLSESNEYSRPDRLTSSISKSSQVVENANVSNSSDADGELYWTGVPRNVEGDLSEWEDMSSISALNSYTSMPNTPSGQAPAPNVDLMPSLESDAVSDVSSIILTEDSSVNRKSRKEFPSFETETDDSDFKRT